VTSDDKRKKASRPLLWLWMGTK